MGQRRTNKSATHREFSDTTSPRHHNGRDTCGAAPPVLGIPPAPPHHKCAGVGSGNSSGTAAAGAPPRVGDSSGTTSAAPPPRVGNSSGTTSAHHLRRHRGAAPWAPAEARRPCGDRLLTASPRPLPVMPSLQPLTTLPAASGRIRTRASSPWRARWRACGCFRRSRGRPSAWVGPWPSRSRSGCGRL